MCAKWKRLGLDVALSSIFILRKRQMKFDKITNISFFIIIFKIIFSKLWTFVTKNWLFTWSGFLVTNKIKKAQQCESPSLNIIFQNSWFKWQSWKNLGLDVAIFIFLNSKYCQRKSQNFHGLFHYMINILPSCEHT